MAEVIVFPSAAAYRLTFSHLALDESSVLAGKLADILVEFPYATELRVSCDEPPDAAAVLYVALPVDVTPEILDRKAEALRTRWREREKR